MSYGLLPAQLSTIPDSPAELAVTQYSGVTIAAGLLVVLDATNQIGGTTPAIGGQPGGTFESLSLACALPTASSPAVGSLGVLRASLPTGQIGTVITRGLVPVIAAGSISARNLLSICTVSGKLGRAQVAVTGEEIIAQALTDASDGATFWVRLFGSVSIHA